MSSRAEALPRSLVAAVLLLTLLVIGLGGAIIAVKLRPSEGPVSVTDTVIEQWQAAVDDDPKSDTARTGLGLALLDAGREDAARSAFEDALSLNAKNWMANFQLGLLLRASDPRRAIELMDDAARFAPQGNKAVPLVAEGDLLLSRGDAAAARDAYQRSISDVPYVFDSHFGLARAFEALGETKKAIAEYRAAGRFDPANPDVRAALRRLRRSD